MKNLFLMSFAVLFLTFTACSKDEDNTPIPLDDTTWVVNTIDVGAPRGITIDTEIIKEGSPCIQKTEISFKDNNIFTGKIFSGSDCEDSKDFQGTYSKEGDKLILSSGNGKVELNITKLNSSSLVTTTTLTPELFELLGSKGGPFALIKGATVTLTFNRK